MPPDDAPLILHLDPKLHEQFIAETEAARQPALQVVQDLIRGYVARQRETRMRAELEEALREADDPRATRIPNEEVEAEWRLRRAELLARADSTAA